MKRQRQLIRAVIVLALVCVFMAFWLVRVYSTEKAMTDQPTYTIYIEEDGRAQIDVANIAYVQQKADGTLVIEGGGEPVEW